MEAECSLQKQWSPVTSDGWVFCARICISNQIADELVIPSERIWFNFYSICSSSTFVNKNVSSAVNELYPANQPLTIPRNWSVWTRISAQRHICRKNKENWNSRAEKQQTFPNSFSNSSARYIFHSNSVMECVAELFASIPRLNSKKDVFAIDKIFPFQWNN